MSPANDEPGPDHDAVLETAAPAMEPVDAQGIARNLFGVDGEAQPLVSERDCNFRLVTGDDQRYVLKIANPAESRSVVDFQTRALAHIATVNPELPVPRVQLSVNGSESEVVDVDGRDCIVRLVSYLEGRLLEDVPSSPDLRRALGTVLAQIDRALRGLFHPAAGHRLLWDLKQAPALRKHLPSVQDPVQREMAESVLDLYARHVEPLCAGLRSQVIHNDLNPCNVVIDTEDATHVTGVIDFGDMVHAPLINEVAIAAAYQTLASDDPVRAAADLVGAYHAVNPLEQDEVSLLPYLILTRLASSVLIASWRSAHHRENLEYITGDIDESGDAIASLLKTGIPVVSAAFADACGQSPAGKANDASAGAGSPDLVDRRNRFLGESLELSYDKPLHLILGRGVWLVDRDGRRYLDAYNNVAHVGHCHPQVVSAIEKQARTLNTNTRYLHGKIVALAERIAASMPGDLSVCMFVCTGSEANDLAWRIAHSVTGNSGAIVTEKAYHGNTTAVTELSPEEMTERQPEPWVETVPAPDTYRMDLDDSGSGSSHFEPAIGRLEARGHRLAAFMYDTIYSSDGIFLPPEAYLQSVFDAVRAAGGLCIADEVQAGFGRTGDVMWGFERQQVMPDIVTLGKPMGNGHPIAAVVTTPDIASRFTRDQYYFNTFGGNPVSAAAGLAVLDVLERECLLDNAVNSGDHLRACLHELASHHEAIGDIRGAGLFTGLEFVSDRETRQADADLARRVVNGMRASGVLIGRTGIRDNVLKIRPPMVFSRSDADLFCETLDAVLTSSRAAQSVTHD